ncbi:aromatic amino acid transport family protein [Vibrio natriegens]|uniref:HAAAP family serine/threonine permease n=1 Tax=Vibrio natriegens NBRC 15636 = ATCC 14048 = DSM 759 TaxID=1219067 RepID=A0AAN1CXK1_VIBNA|nr:aromatic amino acid transport family protein [Vibrio natriegens]ALR18414.1 serine/threonine protein kinase [Vibrio natriegens NBRC 15636 = ATCC 14048 = DSM 759]ANQ14361.1 HAAAP family serine/threonine permease [Vibrio natriegens NBRC 15636 = ATCC 14048 = DSM 759]EPM40403.1 septum formation initiator [Vibrio natriegens NBRC 15636 = ATCC 14048 = DSM 759]MDX6028696.1 aromatic amino acid transport family protein [Vibrio natriegens NBRC 15636 = ATCC 14048 = DSM 759]UUI14586.1 HAAAP family serine
MKESQKTLGYSELNTTSWSKHDTHWVLSLFGTAVGAGILFLPINLGIGGFWPLVSMAILAFPMTFLAHRGLARFVLSSKIKNADFTDVVEEHFGAKAGRAISLLYFLSIFPILLIYGVGITNTVDSFMVNQAGMASIPRPLLSGVLVFGLIAIMMAGEKVMLRAFAVMVYPLVAILAFLSFYLMPNWTMPVLNAPEMGSFANTMWLAVPVVIFSFSHAAAISSFANVQRRHYGKDADFKSELILRRTSVMLIAFVLLFVFSCVLSLSPQQLTEAKAQNVSVLSYLANATDNPFIATLGPLVAFVAITSSFLGHFLGARESLNGLLTKNSNLPQHRADKVSVVVLFISIWIAAIMNPSILGMMEALSGPVIAMILFIMPMMAVYKIESLKDFRGKLSTYFVLVTGIVAVSALIFSLVG